MSCWAVLAAFAISEDCLLGGGVAGAQTWHMVESGHGGGAC